MSKGMVDPGVPMRSTAKQQQRNAITLPGSRKRSAPSGQGQITERTVYTLCPSPTHDHRVQCSPDEVVSGGFLDEWKRLRGMK